VISLIEVRQATRLTVIASGGVRTGVDVAKALTLGADAAGLALPLLKPALEGYVEKFLQKIIRELTTAMFLTGAKSVEDLRESAAVITGKTAAWLRARGLRPETYAMRGSVVG
jgi:isopentenyl-diphosphate delta-isomerase